MNSNPKRIHILLCCILLAGLGLRLYRLGTESLWLDEGFTVYYARFSFLEILNKMATEENHPPLYYSIIHVWRLIAGESEFAVRLPSVIFGSLSIFMIYLTGCLMAGREVGILSALILALSRFHIHFSQEARSYALLVFLALLSFYFLLKLSINFRRRYILGYIAASFLLMHTHVYALFLVLAQNLYCILRYITSAKQRQDLTLKRWIFLQLILLILFIPWLTVLITQFLRVQQGYWMNKPPLYWIPGTFLRYSGSYNVLSGILAVFFFLLACNSFMTFENGKIKWRKNSKTNHGLLLLWLLVPILLPFLLSQFSTPVYQIKSTIGASLAYYILIATGIANWRWQKFKPALIGLIVALSLINLYLYYQSVKKERWREAAEFVQANAKKNDLVLFVAGYCRDGVYAYYAQKDDIVLQSFPKRGSDVTEENIDELAPWLDNHDRIWLILSHHYDHDPKRLVKQTLLESFHLKKQKVLLGKEKFVFPNINARILSWLARENYCRIEIYLFEK